MRYREIIRDRKRASRLDISLDAATLQKYIDACQCPFCRDGIAYKMLPLHIYQMHGITAYQLRKDAGWDRGHKLISQETSELIAEKTSQPHRIKAFLSHPNWNDISSRYSDGGKRLESLEAMSKIANSPKTKATFKQCMSKIDHRAISLSIPPKLRSERSRQGAITIKKRNPRHFIEMGEKGGRVSASRRKDIPKEVINAWHRKAAQTRRIRYGDDYAHQLGLKGGAAVKQKYAGTSHWHDIGVKGAKVRLARKTMES